MVVLGWNGYFLIAFGENGYRYYQFQYGFFASEYYVVVIASFKTKLILI